jgi:DNA repair photolyase
MDLPILPTIHGRGTSQRPGNRFEAIEVVLDGDELDREGLDRPATRVFRDTTRTIIARNDSPDVGFDVSINPYRGCEHGCIYCYARPTHEYFGLSAGLDFETRIFAKTEAPALLRRELASRRWQPTTIAISGVTDPYQPIERRLELTRGCLEVLAEAGNPFSIITKNHLVTRDVDLIAEMAAKCAASVNISITTLDPSLQRLMEPRASTPDRRLDAVAKLASSGIPVGVMVAPIVPGLTDHEMPEILRRSAEAGATTAGFIQVRLPFAVAGLFERWLEDHFPDRKKRVLGLIREIRGGRLNDPRFGSRFRGEGEYAGQIGRLFEATCGKLGLNRERGKLSVASWTGVEAAPKRTAQLSLFG